MLVCCMLDFALSEMFPVILCISEYIEPFVRITLFSDKFLAQNFHVLVKDTWRCENFLFPFVNPHCNCVG